LADLCVVCGCGACRELIWGAKGLAFLTIVKAGFFFTGRLGSGLVIGRNDDGTWSAPSAIGCTGVGWGFQLGGEVSLSLRIRIEVSRGEDNMHTEKLSDS
jgi:lipid-binding SYLF domain-containing protein